MKLLYILSVFCLFIIQPKPADPIDRTAMLLKQNNVAELCKTFAGTVELTVLNEENNTPKQQAQTILTNFFIKYPVSEVKVLHRVDSNPQIKFAVFLLSGRGGNYRLAVSYRNAGDVYEISEFRIEEEKSK